MRVTLLSDIFVFLLLCPAPGVAALTRSISLLVCVFVSVALPRRLFGAGRASCLQERDETRPVKHRGARPLMGTQPVLFALHFPPAPGAVGVHDFTPYFEVFFTSSNVRRPCSMSLSTSGAMPRIAAFSNRLRRSLTRASRAALPFCQRSLASGLTRPSPPQKSHARSIGWHPRSLQAIPKPAFAPWQSGQTTVNMTYLLLCPLPRRGRAFVLLRSHRAPFFGGNPFTKNSGVAPRSRCRRAQPAGVTSAALDASFSAVARLQWRAPATNGSERSGQPSEPLGAARTTRRLRARAARATAEKLAPERRAAPVRVAGSRGGVIAQRAWGGMMCHRSYADALASPWSRSGRPSPRCTRPG